MPVGDLDGANVFLVNYMALNAGANVRRAPRVRTTVPHTRQRF